METIFSKSHSGRRGSSLPEPDVPCTDALPPELRRAEPAAMPEVSELDGVRHFVNLSRRNMAIDTCFYPLGSCTMKYNPKFHERIASLPGFRDLHPLLPQLRRGGALTQGALAVIYETESFLCELLGFSAFTMQPLAGAHGELAGVMMIAAYHRANQDDRPVMLIADSAHGTNPASAAMAGFETRTVPTGPDGNVDMEAFRAALSPRVAGMMLTCPSTLGLYDPNTREICRLVHENGALMYGDGANLNALLGRVRPGDLGFDVVHVNLHKTFATPHGGGGPGAGPVGVSEQLVRFLPTSRVLKRNDGSYALEYSFPDTVGYVAPFYGNFAIILRAYAYMLTLGKEGMRRAGEAAVLNANYLRARLRTTYQEPHDRACMHECVFSAQSFVRNGVHALDVGKELLDRGFHAPTVYFPLTVPEALMIEPTETESKQTLDAFADALIDIARKVQEDAAGLSKAPISMPVSRLDETRAARHLDLASLGERD
ncbi:MAG: aminomethyl-transferring glycine dehydrogenase subunit GcvPB [Lentisphaerae bacterium]|nr:aminomethyl-transferring glycine dehydrogenase subunit GcvPB [Lentisphaerota bacterium]MBT5611596.1 aminomethyl-transferring glycine dehydrogenase subunit GcvPB [Lentisphaerota bacterium]MBT7061695.1 aminomethyl-transferring glycine dehydrogenase subunit GcvPB [Lentisphaerota bacterium]MBT7846541.1 aminomethyl-transferring glycine dehydrogenase subunit GcvPB [Lentisphaerota bacterium]